MIEVKEFIIESVEDMSVGISSSQYTLTGSFFFEIKEEIEDFKADLKNLFDSYNISETSLNIYTDIEYQAMCDYEDEMFEESEE